MICDNQMNDSGAKAKRSEAVSASPLDGSEATEFYRKHRRAMDAGGVVAWAERYNEDELSALQHAMNLRLQDEAAFFAEYQNEPVGEAGVLYDRTVSLILPVFG